MKKTPNYQLDELILNHLTKHYNLDERRDSIHLSTLVYCLTRSFIDHVDPIAPTEEELMLFAIGYGLQDVMTPENTETPTFEQDGVTFRPDFMLKLNGDAYAEIKTTRMSTARPELPETWYEYIKGGCYMRGVEKYYLSILHLMGNYKPPFPQIRSFTLEFTEDELQFNWDYLMARKRVFDEAIQTNTPPTQFMYCKDWECKNCRYKLQCDAMDILARRKAEG